MNMKIPIIALIILGAVLTTSIVVLGIQRDAAKKELRTINGLHQMEISQFRHEITSLESAIIKNMTTINELTKENNQFKTVIHLQSIALNKWQESTYKRCD